MTENKNNIPELRFPEFDEEWKNRKLGDLLSFKNGINASKDSYGRGFKFINVLDIINNKGITYDSIIGSVNVSLEEFNKNIVEYGDILFQRSSETRKEVGQSNVYLDEVKKATFGGFVIRGKKIGDYNPVFMHLLLKSKSARKEITTKSGGSTRYNVGQDTLSLVKLFYPSLPEQQKIASFLTAVDDKIQKLSKKKELLEKYKKGIMQKIFSQEIRFKDDDGNDYPAWEEKKLSQFLKLEVRKINKPKSNYLSLGIRSHGKGLFHKTNFDPEKIEMDFLFKVKPKDLIVNITFAWEGAIAIVEEKDKDGLVSHRFPTYVFDEKKVEQSFFNFIITSKKFIHQLGLISPGGAGRNRVMSKTDFIKIKCSIPCLNEQQKIADFFTSIDKKIESVTLQIEKTKQFKKSLLQKMFV